MQQSCKSITHSLYSTLVSATNGYLDLPPITKLHLTTSLCAATINEYNLFKDIQIFRDLSKSLVNGGLSIGNLSEILMMQLETKKLENKIGSRSLGIFMTTGFSSLLLYNKYINTISIPRALFICLLQYNISNESNGIATLPLGIQVNKKQLPLFLTIFDAIIARDIRGSYSGAVGIVLAHLLKILNNCKIKS